MMHSSRLCDSCGAENQSQATFCSSCGHTLNGASMPAGNDETGQLPPNHLLKQRYRILATAGKGGMGAVYSAEDTALGNRKVAIKEMSYRRLREQETLSAVEAFKREAHILAGLQHPNLPNIYDYFTEAGRWYLVMNFINGETLSQYTYKANEGKLPVAEVLQVGIQLCTVLHYLHMQQPPIVFRDLKPGNIMRMADGHIYLIDFGIVRHFKPGQAQDTAAFGSAGYAAPEQYGQAQTTPRSDIYSLGAVLYQLLSGYEPAATPFRLPPLQSLVPAIPAELAKLIRQMLEMDENKRPASMLEVKQGLEHIATSASPPLASTLYVRPVPGRSNPAAPTEAIDAGKVAPGQMVMAPGKSTEAIPAVASTNMWRVGVRQLLAIVIGLLLCGMVYYGVAFLIYSMHISPQNLSIYAYVLSGLILVLPLFFGFIGGPWVGLCTAGIGCFVADYLVILTLSTSLAPIHLAWEFDAGATVLGLLAGLALLVTRGRYERLSSVLLATLLGSIGAGIVEAVVLSAPSLDAVLSALPVFVLLLILLFAYGAFSRSRKRDHG